MHCNKIRFVCLLVHAPSRWINSFINRNIYTELIVWSSWKHTVHVHTQEISQVFSGCVTVNDSTSKYTTDAEDLRVLRDKSPSNISQLSMGQMWTSALCTALFHVSTCGVCRSFILVFLNRTCSAVCFKTCTVTQAVIRLWGLEVCEVVHTVTDLPHFHVLMM